MTISKRNHSPITKQDLQKLLRDSKQKLYDYFLHGNGAKWLDLYDIKSPLCVALCQGAAMHYHDGKNGVKDFDVWFFYAFNETHLPYRALWIWDFGKSKFGKHPDDMGFKGRRVDVMVRSLKKYDVEDPIGTIHQYLEENKTKTARELAKKAVVLLSPDEYFGKTIWYKKPVLS